MEKRLSSRVAPGDVVGGKYRIERLLGEGGMGLVYVAHQERLNRRVALKCLRPRLANRGEAHERFEREARAVAALHSDHVAKIIDVGQFDNGSPYLVMELLEGEDLAQLLERCGALAPQRATSIVLDVCDAVGEAHGLGIIHRDLKPANIFLHRRANMTTVTKVLDFGISKSAPAPNQAELTATAAIMGSPHYMSPEQLRDARNVTARTDVWALGVTLYELLTGAPPFVAGSFARMCTLVMTADPPPMLSTRDALPPDLDALVMRCLTKDPEARFASAKELADALRLVKFESDVSLATTREPLAALSNALAQSTPDEEVETDVRPPDLSSMRASGTLIGLDSPNDATTGRSERATGRLRRGLVVAAAFAIGGAAFAATTLLPTEAPRALASQAETEAAPAVASSAPSAVEPGNPPAPPAAANVATAYEEPPPVPSAPAGPTATTTEKPRRPRAPPPRASAVPADPFDLPLAR